MQEYAKANKIKYDFSILKDLLPQAKAWAEERTKKEEAQDLQTKTEKKHERRAFKQEVLNRPEKQETPKAKRDNASCSGRRGYYRQPNNNILCYRKFRQ